MSVCSVISISLSGKSSNLKIKIMCSSVLDYSKKKKNQCVVRFVLEDSKKIGSIYTWFELVHLFTQTNINTSK